MLKDKIFDKTVKLEDLAEKNQKIDYETTINQIRKEMIDIFTFLSFLKTQWSKHIEKELKEKINQINEKYKNKNEFLEKLYFVEYSNIIFYSRLYEEKFELIKRKISSEEKKFFEKLALKYYPDNSTFFWIDTPSPWDLWWFENLKELENWFIKYYEKYAKLYNQEIYKLNYEKFLKKIWFEYSNWTNTYLKVLYVESSIWSISRETIFEKFRTVFNKLLAEWLIKDVEILNDSQTIVKELAHQKNNSENSYVSFSPKIKMVLDEKSSMEIFEVFYGKEFLAYVFSVKDVDEEVLFNFSKNSYNFYKSSKDGYLNFSSYNSNILNLANQVIKGFDKLKLNLSLEEVIKKYFKFSVDSSLLTMQNVVTAQTTIKKVFLENERFNFSHIFGCYPWIVGSYYDRELPDVEKMVTNWEIWFNNLKLENNILTNFDLNKDIDYLIFWKPKVRYVKDSYRKEIPYKFLDLPKWERFNTIQEYFWSNSEFKYKGSESKWYKEVTD